MKRVLHNHIATDIAIFVLTAGFLAGAAIGWRLFNNAESVRPPQSSQVWIFPTMSPLVSPPSEFPVVAPPKAPPPQ